MPRRHFVALDTRATWPARYAAGVSQRDIAEADGVSRATVCLALRDLGVPKRPRGAKRGSKWHSKALAEIAAGEDVAVVAARHGVSWQTLYKTLQRRAGWAAPPELPAPVDPPLEYGVEDMSGYFGVGF